MVVLGWHESLAEGWQESLAEGWQESLADLSASVC
jgi:hypothetical protein